MDVPLYFTTMALIEDEERLSTEKIIWKNYLEKWFGL